MMPLDMKKNKKSLEKFKNDKLDFKTNLKLEKKKKSFF